MTNEGATMGSPYTFTSKRVIIFHQYQTDFSIYSFMYIILFVLSSEKGQGGHPLKLKCASEIILRRKRRNSVLCMYVKLACTCR